MDPGFHNRTIIGKKAEERIPEQVDPHADDQPDQKRIGQADKIAFQNPFSLPCAQVLCDKAGTGGIKSRHHIIHQRVGVGGCGIAFHNHVIKGIDAGLHKEVSDSKQSVLKSGGNADLQNPLHFVRIQFQTSHAECKGLPASYEDSQDQNRREILGYDAGSGNAGHIPSAYNDKIQIQKHVDDPGKQKIIQRTPGIAGGAQHSAAEIIKSKGGHAQQIDAQVKYGVQDQLVFGVHDRQDRMGKQDAEYQDQHPGGKAQNYRSMYGLPQVPVVSGADMKSRQCIDAAGEPDDQPGKQCDQDAGGAHSAQSNGSREFAHHGHVRHVKKHLQNIGEHERNTEKQDFFPERSAAKIHFVCFHHNTLSIIKSPFVNGTYLSYRKSQKKQVPEFFTRSSAPESEKRAEGPAAPWHPHNRHPPASGFAPAGRRGCSGG